MLKWLGGTPLMFSQGCETILTVISDFSAGLTLQLLNNLPSFY